MSSSVSEHTPPPVVATRLPRAEQGRITGSGTVAEPAREEPHADRADTRPTKRSTDARDKGAPRVPRPPQVPLQPGGGAGASGSSVGGGSGLSPVAAVGLFVLAAPVFGWQLRTTRELSPRGAYGSSIDRPG
jgi:hypothetical protein